MGASQILSKVALGILGIVVLFAVWLPWGGRNAIIEDKNVAAQQISVVQVQEQRRGEMYQNLVATVSGGADLQKTIFKDVAEARAKVGQINVSAKDLVDDPVKMKQFLDASQQMSSALSRLLATVESYPKVDASGFSTLQSQIEGTENRIAVARRDYVIAVKNYNTRIEKFPGAVIAGFFNFKSLPEYQAPAATREVPKIDFTKKS